MNATSVRVKAYENKRCLPPPAKQTQSNPIYAIGIKPNFKRKKILLRPPRPALMWMSR